MLTGHQPIKIGLKYKVSTNGAKEYGSAHTVCSKLASILTDVAGLHESAEFVVASIAFQNDQSTEKSSQSKFRLTNEVGGVGVEPEEVRRAFNDFDLFRGEIGKAVLEDILYHLRIISVIYRVLNTMVRS